jgi:hypothetical protein
VRGEGRISGSRLQRRVRFAIPRFVFQHRAHARNFIYGTAALASPALRLLLSAWFRMKEI